MPTIVPVQIEPQNFNRQIIFALVAYVFVIASLVAFFSYNPKVAEWISQSAQAEFVNEQFERPASIVTAKLGNVAFP